MTNLRGKLVILSRDSGSDDPLDYLELRLNASGDMPQRVPKALADHIKQKIIQGQIDGESCLNGKDYDWTWISREELEEQQRIEKEEARERRAADAERRADERHRLAMERADQANRSRNTANMMRAGWFALSLLRFLKR